MKYLKRQYLVPTLFVKIMRIYAHMLPAGSAVSAGPPDLIIF